MMKVFAVLFTYVFSNMLMASAERDNKLKIQAGGNILPIFNECIPTHVIEPILFKIQYEAAKVNTNDIDGSGVDIYSFTYLDISYTVTRYSRWVGIRRTNPPCYGPFSQTFLF